MSIKTLGDPPSVNIDALLRCCNKKCLLLNLEGILFIMSGNLFASHEKMIQVNSTDFYLYKLIIKNKISFQ